MPAGILTPSEKQLHRTVAEFLDVALVPPTVWTTFPAGWGKLSDAMAGELRACGLKKGFPDILIFDIHQIIANRTYTKVVGIELKTKTKASAAQQLMFPRLRDLGIAVYVCHDLQQVIAALREQCVIMRARGWDNEAPSNKGTEARRAEEPPQGPQAA